MHKTWLDTSHWSFYWMCVSLAVLAGKPSSTAAGEPCPNDSCCKGDVDLSGELNGGDVQFFVEALLSPPVCGTAEFCASDADDNGFLDLDDAAAFVNMLVEGNPCPPPPDNYCIAGALDEFEEEFISRVVLDTLNNPSAGNLPGNYQDFTPLPPPSLSIGIPATMTVHITNYFPADRVKVWVDWNHDADLLDPGEEFTLADSGSGGSGVATVALAPPAGAVLGTTRLRVRLFYSFGSEIDFGPCGQAEFGEVEDYTVNVIP